MFLTMYRDRMPETPRNQVRVIALSPIFGEILNTLGQLWKLPEMLTLTTVHDEDKDQGPFSIFYVRHDAHPNKHPAELNLLWIKITGNINSKSPTACVVEFYKGTEKVRNSHPEFVSVYHHALSAAHYLFAEYTDMTEVSKYQDFSLDSF